jgi:hypothetical protein
MDRGFRETSRSRCFAAFSQGPTSADTSRQTRMGLGLATRRSRHAGHPRAPGAASLPAVTLAVPRSRPLSPRPRRDGVGAGEASLRR